MSGSAQLRLLNDIARIRHGLPWDKLNQEQQQQCAWALFEIGVAVERTAIILNKTNLIINRHTDSCRSHKAVAKHQGR